MEIFQVGFERVSQKAQPSLFGYLPTNKMIDRENLNLP
jgi:hypothetical protein